MTAESSASVAQIMLAACLLTLLAWVYAGPAAANSAAGGESPNAVARKRPSVDAGAFFASTHRGGLARSRSLSMAAGAEEPQGSPVPQCRSLNFAPSVTTGESAVTDFTTTVEITVMRSLAEEADRLRAEAAQLREFNPFYRLSYHTCDDRTDSQFVPPPLPKDRLAAKELGERMALELAAAIEEAAEIGLSNCAALVIRTTFKRCKSPWALYGFASVLAEMMADSMDMVRPENWRERHDLREAMARQAAIRRWQRAAA